ncbi:Cytochrome P450 monooxygenase aba1 [Gnomoniopsis smithogilvyi]|uniref:Cytochrome P450 monooxygenase aba1 n=1 Tax=Gnomoniopsis smithogilvyi TaxID=1191159 RepID=A0A9W8YLQ4_9PEZI|nr:Cytochrome P450 monooxygenase aba1 [Gnomoniopsis smithogilvyi]
MEFQLLGESFSLDAIHIGSLGLSALALCYLVTAISRWWRLRHIPGPFIAKFSYFWLGKTTHSGKQYYVHRELHKKYGPLVRIAPNYVITDEPHIIKSISSARSGYHRDDWYTTGRFNPWRDNLFSRTDPAIHSKAKLRLAGSYNGRETTNLESNVDEQVQSLISLMRSKYAVSARSPSRPLLDLGPTSNYFTLDVITKVAFGQHFGYMNEEKDLYNFMRLVRELWPRMSVSADVPWIRRILFSKPFLSLFGPKTTDKEGFGALMRVAEYHVSQRFKQDAKELDDSLGSLIKKGLTQEECESEGLFLIVGGTESTASALRSILIHTMTCPQVYKSLKGEIFQAINGGRLTKTSSDVIRNDEAASLSYLRAVIYEGIRMRPPLLGLFPKVVPPEGEVFDGKFIPGGTGICMNTSSLLRRQDLFGQDAHVFRPERFLELGAVGSPRRNEMERNVELAFGYGANQCVGKPLALMEIYKAIFEVYRNFDLQLVSPSLSEPCDYEGYGVFLEVGMFIKVYEVDREGGDNAKELHM